MVRTVNNKGFSFVEILVSMVILAIVVLVMTNVLVSTSKQHGKAAGEDTGEMLALEKLAELQNHVIPAQDGHDQIDKQNQTYVREWKIESTTPPRVTVTVSWTDVLGNLETSEIIGYIDVSNLCPDRNSTPDPANISGLSFIGYDALVTTNAEVVYNGRVEAAGGSIEADVYIARFKPDDANITFEADGITVDVNEDNYTYEITPENNPDKYYIKNDSLFTAVKLKNTGGFSYPVTVKATDCDGASATATLLVTLNNAPFEIFPTDISIDEGTTKSFEIFASKAATNWQVTAQDAAGASVTPNPGVPNTTDGKSVTFNFADLNYEALSLPITVTVSAADASTTTDTDSKDMTLTVNDIPEMPDAVAFKDGPGTLTTVQLNPNVDKSSIVDTLAITDDDVPASGYTFFVQSKKASNSVITTDQLFRVRQVAGPYWILVTNVEKSTLQSYPEELYTVDLQVTDNDVGSSQTPATFSLSVNLSSSAGTNSDSQTDADEASYNCNNPNWVYANGYVNGQVVKQNDGTVDSLYRALIDIIPASNMSKKVPGTDATLWLGVYECP